MRIVHLLRPAQGGMLRQVRALLTDPEVDGLLAAPPETLARWGEPLREAPLPLPAIDSIKAQLAGGLAAGRWARRVGAELLHGHGLARTPLYAIAALRSGLPLVVTLHNLVGPLSSAQRGALRWALGRARRVIVVSDAVGRSAESIVPAERRRRVYNGVELSRFADLPDRTEARRRLGWDSNGEVALCVARLSPEKGLDTLADLPVRVVVAGDGPERARLEALGGGVTWLGERDDVPLLLAASDLYIQPSRQEGLGLAVIEAQAAGVPVVATRVGGLPEAVSDGVTGILADDPLALRRAVEGLVGDAAWRTRLGEAGRARVAREFTVDAMRAATRIVYAEALA